MSLSDPLEPPLSRPPLPEELEVALIDLMEGEALEPSTRAALVEALGGERALERALEEARRDSQLAQRLSVHFSEVTPPEGFVGAVLTQTQARRRKRPTPTPKARFWVELWALAISLTLLTTAWLALNALKRAQDQALQQRLTPLPPLEGPASPQPSP